MRGGLGVVWAGLLLAGCGIFGGRGDDVAVVEAFDPSRPPAPGPLPSWEAPEVRREVLPNGLEVVVVERERPTMHLLAAVGAGWASEPADAPGVARLSAAMMRVEAGGWMAGELSAALDRLGDGLQITVTPDLTLLDLPVPADAAPEGLDLLAALLTSPGAHAGARETALARLGREVQLRGGGEGGWEDAERYVWGGLFPGQALGLPWPTAGMLQGAGVEAVLAWRARHLTPDNTRVYLLGPGASELPALVAARIGAWTGRAAAAPPPTRPTPPNGGLVVVEGPASDRARVLLGALGFPEGSLSAPAAALLAQIVGGGPGSRLDLALARRSIDGRDVRATHEAWRAGGALSLRFDVPEEVLPGALDALGEVLDEARGGIWTAEDLAAARRALIGAELGALGDLRRVGLGLAAVDGARVGPRVASWRSQLQAVADEDVRQISRALFRGDRLVMVVVGDPARVEAPARAWSGLEAPGPSASAAPP